MTTALPTPKVFVSYAWTDEPHIEWVLHLCKRLVNDGIDVIIDQWEELEGRDKFVFMERMVADPSVTRVLCICNKAYKEKADKRVGGVGTESQIISKEVYENVEEGKFIPIIREKDEHGEAYVPVFFRNRFYIDFSNDENFEASVDKLLRALYGKREHVKPKLGKPPAHLTADSAPAVRPLGKLDRLKDVVNRGLPHVRGALEDYAEAFRESLEEFRLTKTSREDGFDDAVVENVTSFIPHRDNFIDFMTFAARNMTDPGSREQILSFLESLLSLQEPASGKVNQDSDNFRFILYELFLYAVTALIKEKQYDFAAAAMVYQYQVRDSRANGEFKDVGASFFDIIPLSLDEIRNHRLEINHATLTGDLILERCTLRRFKRSDLVQTDLLMFLRRFFPRPGGADSWDGRMICYLAKEEMPELFARGRSNEAFKALQTLLGGNDRKDFVAIVRGIQFDRYLRQDVFANRHIARSIEEILNLKAIEEGPRR